MVVSTAWWNHNDIPSLKLFLSRIYFCFSAGPTCQNRSTGCHQVHGCHRGEFIFICTSVLISYNALKLLRSFTDKISKPLEWESSALCRFILDCWSYFWGFSISPMLSFPFLSSLHDKIWYHLNNFQHPSLLKSRKYKAAMFSVFLIGLQC